MMLIFPIIDVETTGLDPDSCDLLEIAVIFVDTDLNEISRHEWTKGVKKAELEDILLRTDDFVIDMHTNNGLFEDCRSSAWTLGEIDGELAGELEVMVAQGHTFRTVGNSLRLDLNFIERYLPKTYKALGYRSIDMSAVAKFLEIFDAHDEYVKQPTIAHRAMADNEQCLAQMRHHAEWLGWEPAKKEKA